MAGSVLRGQRLAVSLLLALWAITAIEAGPDSVTSFDNRPPGSGSTPSSSASSGSSAPGSSSTSSSGRAPAASASSSSSSSLPGPLSSSRSSSSGGISCNSKSIIPRGNLSVAKTWSETAPLSLDFVPLPKGQCVGWTISAEALAETDCADKSAENYILVEFWQLGDNTTISGGSIGGPGSGRSTLPKVPYGGPVVDVKVLAARGTKPSLTFASDGQELNKVIPPIRDPTTGLTPVGSFQDDAGVVYNRPVLRVMFPTDSPVTDVGDPGDPNSWYVTIANMPDQEALPAYAIRASCININPPARAPDGSLAAAAAAAAAANRSSSSSSSSSKAPASLKGAGMPCPVPSPGGKQCNGHGTCRTDTADLSPEYSRYCACDAGWGSWGCQLQLLSLPLNAPEPVTATIPPGKWGYWEVTLPAWQGQGPMGGPSDAAAGRGSSGGSGGGGSNEQLLLMAERVPGPGMGGNPLLFLKPFDNKDHNEPTLDEMSLAQYADLRSFQLQLNRQFINYRLPLRESRGPTPGSRGLARPRRWYVAIYNSNASRLSEPARVKLWVQYRDLTRQNPACPFDCNGRGRCLDPLTPLPGIGMRGSALPGTLPQGLPRLPGAAAPGGDSSKALGLNPDLASLIALGPLQDLTPMDVGFMCACNQGFGGLMCEGRVQNLTVGSGEQKAGPEVLEPGAWSYYVVTIDSGFNPNSDNLGIQWIVGQPSSPPSNYSNAYISFDQGPLHRQQQLMGMSRQQVRRGMTPYSKLVVRSNPPLPLQVPGGQLSPGGTYVVSVFNNDYVVNMPFIYSLAFYVMAENQSYLHPYMSILLGVTAAVILCLAMTLCKRVVVRYGFVPWRWRQRRRQLQEAAAAGAGGAGGPNSLALVLMAQGQPASRGVPPEIYNAFPCRPYAVKEFQKRQHEAMQQQEEDSAPTGAVPAAAAAANDTTNAPDQGTRRSPTAAATAAAAAAAATAAANAAALDAAATGITAAPAAVDLEAGRTPPAAAAAAAATASPAAAVAVVSPASGASPGSGQWWRLPNLHWSSTAAASRADPTAAAANAPQASPAAASVKSPGTAGTKAGADAAAAAAAAAAKDSGAGGLQEDFDVPTCAVCLCEYASGELVRQLPCNHEFHQSCIDQWMVSHGTCPICRAPLWAGALEDQAQADDGGSNGQEDNDPAAIYVHHELGAAAGREGRPPRGLAGRAGAVGDREWVRALRQWRERNRQQQLQRQQRHQPHADEAAPATVEPASPMATWQELAIAQLAIAQMQQQQEALAVHSPPSQQQPSQPLQQQQPQQPPHLAAAAEAASDAPAAGAAGAGAGGSSGGSDTFMGAFSLGRRRQQRDQGQ